MQAPQLVQCTAEKHADTILEIFNDAIATSTSLYDCEPRTSESMRAWFELKSRHGFPVIGLQDASQSMLGFATYGTFRNFAGYRFTVEHSIYIHKNHRGRGLGKLLMQEIINCAEKHGVHVMVGVIDAANQTSIALHEKFDFSYAGTLREVGFKFNRWLDILFYQKIFINK